jgi:hypothetical protein
MDPASIFCPNLACPAGLLDRLVNLGSKFFALARFE